MGVARRVHLLLLLALPLPILPTDSFAASLDCTRINVAFCCTSRIRETCTELCKSVECSPSFYKGVFNTDAASASVARDGDAVAGGTWDGTDVRENGDVRENSPPPFRGIPESVRPPSESAFPTLIPFQPEVTQLPQVSGSGSVRPSAPSQLPLDSSAQMVPTDAVDPMAPPAMPPVPPFESTAAPFAGGPQTTAVQKPRVRPTPDPRIIRPPESLAFITDFDEDYNDVIKDKIFVNSGGASSLDGQVPSGPTAAVASALHHRAQLSSTDSAASALAKGTGRQRKRAPSRRRSSAVSAWQRAIWEDLPLNSIDHGGDDGQEGLHEQLHVDRHHRATQQAPTAHLSKDLMKYSSAAVERNPLESRGALSDLRNDLRIPRTNPTPILTAPLKRVRISPKRSNSLKTKIVPNNGVEFH